MRLLFDENISESVARALEDQFPGSLHVRREGLQGADDFKVWQFAIQKQCLLVTRDEDFQQMSILRGQPPKVIHILANNPSNQLIIHVLQENAAFIAEFALGPTAILVIDAVDYRR
jgi:predicted nuclease of predicted toxin-antitoxin system